PLFGICIRLLYGGPSLTPSHSLTLSPSLTPSPHSPSRQGEGEREREGGLGRLPLPVVGSLAVPRILSSRHPASPPSFDLLRTPLLGRFLKWQHARLALQIPLMALAGVVILDGLRGPQVGPMNLAGVLPWIHWRGLVILTLLAAGNFFCMACPFLL